VERTGAQILCDVLKKQKVEYLFAYQGGSVIPVFDALYDEPKLKIILPRHEQGGAHAADGYARATGKVGVCIATSGPGATNLVTGIATANMDSIPMVVITGQVKTNLIGNDAFQEADVTGITRPITKHNYLVKSVDELPQILMEAFHIAMTGRPGVVVVDLPVDVSTSTSTVKIPDGVALEGYQPTYVGNPRQITRAAETINESKQPVIYAGGGIITSSASDELRKLATKGNIPVTTTLMGLGAFPETNALSLGMLGMHGTVYANYAVTHSDLIIAIGARFDDRITGRITAFAPEAQVLHIDIDPSAISKNVEVDIPIVGDAKNILKELLPQVKKKPRTEWLKEINGWKKKHPLAYPAKGLWPQYVIEEIYNVTKGDAIITTEVGQNQMWAAQFYKYTKPRTFISSGGLGTMGFGFPAAIGAQIGNPGRIVFDIAGDGSIQMNIQELATAVRLNLPVNIAILNNGFLGMVRQWQELFYEKRYAQTELTGNPDFVKLAEAYGAEGIRVTTKKEVVPAIKAAVASKHVVVIDFQVSPEANVYPMVPAGEAIDRMIGGMS